MPRRSLTMPSGRRKLKRVGVSSVKNIYGKGRARLCRAFSFSPFQRRRNVVFSPTRKRRKESPRRCLGLPSICWEAYTHGSKGVAVLAGLAQATTPRAGRNCEWEVRARRRKAAVTHLPPVRRVPPWIAYPCGTQTRAGSRRDVLLARTNGQAVRLRLLFVLFLCGQEKNTFLLYKGE